MPRRTRDKRGVVDKNAKGIECLFKKNKVTGCGASGG